jgi:glycosyltransferase involved in cell wall biosynthesis
MAEPLPARILIDCRWLANAGPGRVTELALRSLAELRPAAEWILWGPPSVEEFAWPEARVVESRSDPRVLNGQRSWFEVPDSDLALFMHYQRPLKPVRAITWIHDTIALRHANDPLDRAAKWVFLRGVAAISERVVTGSEFSRRCIERDLGIGGDKISVLGWPVDEAEAERIVALRRDSAIEQIALFAGRFLPHKNLPALIEAFGRTDFHAAGGKLRLVGGRQSQVQELAGSLTPSQLSYVEVLGEVSRNELEELFSRCSFVVLPSLEEGFGLPVWEALSAGLPLCVSDGGSIPELLAAIPEVTAGLVERFGSAENLVLALDSCAAKAKALSQNEAERLAAVFRSRAPSLSEFGGRLLDLLRAAAGPLGEAAGGGEP